MTSVWQVWTAATAVRLTVIRFLTENHSAAWNPNPTTWAAAVFTPGTIVYFHWCDESFASCASCLLQQSLFGNKTAGFGTTTTSAPSFGTGTGLFGNKPALTLGTGTNTSTFGKWSWMTYWFIAQQREIPQGNHSSSTDASGYITI